MDGDSHPDLVEATRFLASRGAVYVNGTAVASAALSGGYTPQTRNPVLIGQGESGAALYFPGQVQEAAIYSTALTPAQVQRHYSVGTTGQ